MTLVPHSLPSTNTLVSILGYLRYVSVQCLESFSVDLLNKDADDGSQLNTSIFDDGGPMLQSDSLLSLCQDAEYLPLQL